MSTVNPFNITAVYIQQRDKTGAKKGPPIYILAENSGFGPHGSEQSGLELGLLKSIVIKESMLDSTMSGSMTFIDRAKLAEKLNLSPLDLINIELFEENSEIFKSLVFSITAVTQDKDDIPSSISGENNVGRYVTLEFTSNELYLLNYSEFDYVENDFIGPISGNNGLVQYLSSNILKKKSKAFSTNISDIKADETFNWIWLKKNPIFYPWGKPDLPSRLFPLLKLLAENAVDKKNPNAANFMFWQDMDNWNFRSIESIITEYENKGDLKTYSYTIETDNANGIITLESSVDSAPETDFFNLVDAGAFASNYIFVEPKYDQDPYARYLDTSGALERKEIKYNYIKDSKKWKSIEKIPILSENEYIEKWDHNRIFDEKYGYFSPNFYNREKSVKWEYYGYTLANRNERTLWQTPFDITDMNGEILRKIQKEIKEPLAKKRLEYAKKMNLKEKWKVYRCSICCAGLMDSGVTGSTLVNELSTYEIVAAGSFTDIFNYDVNKVNPNSPNPFIRSGLTLSYDLNESPYNRTLGQFFNLEQNPSNFTKYKFDLEIARHQKILDVLNKNKQARNKRIQQYENKLNEYQANWNTKVGICIAEQCDDVDCTCPTLDPQTVRDGTARIRQDHKELEEHEDALVQKGVQDIIGKLQSLKEEFTQLYNSYWSRNAFFFSKNLDLTFLKSQNNLFNVKSIKRIPIKGSKYEPFATKKTFPGYTFPNGLTQEYPYSVSKNQCSAGISANPYFDRKYSTNRKADLWESFDNPFKNYPYSENFATDVTKGPIWYRNWLVKYKYKKRVTPCITIPVQNSGCEGECDEQACKCSCYGPVDVNCNGDDCSIHGTEGTDYVRGRCEENPSFMEACTLIDCITFIGGGSGFEGCPVLSRLTPSCCEDIGGQPGTLEDACQSGNYSGCSNCDEDDDGDGYIQELTKNDENEISGPISAINSCTTSSFQDEYTEIPTEMYFESFSNNINSNILNNPNSIKAYVVQKLLAGCDPSEGECIRIDSVQITAEGESPKLMHPWGADLVSNFDYNDYKSAGSLFNDNLTNVTPPSLQLEGLESFVRIQFKQPIGLETLKEFPAGFMNTPGSEYFLPYIVLLTAGPFGAESARANISVIGQDPYGFDVAVKKSKNKDDFGAMNLFDSGAHEAFIPLTCSSFATSSSWMRKSQNSIFYRPPGSDHDLFTPMGIQDIFSASSWERSAPVKTWWDMWFSLPPVATSLYYNRHDVSKAGEVAFFKEGSVVGKVATAQQDNGWPHFLAPDTENIATGVYRGDAAIFPNELLSAEELPGIPFESSNTPFYVEKLTDDPSNYVYRYADFPHITQVNPNKQYPVISYPVGTLIYGGAGFTAGQVWKYDTSRKTEYGLVQLSSDSMPSILALAGGTNKNIERVQKYYEWLSTKMVDWYQNTVFDNNFSAQFVVYSKQTTSSCKDYPCSNPAGFVGTADCPQNDPLCNCPCQNLRPDKITQVKDRFTGAMVPASTGDFGPEPTMLELKKLKDEINECKLIERVLGPEWLGCVWDDPESPYNCKCPCIGNKFYEYMKYNQIYSTFWDTPLQTPLFRNAQMSLLMANRIMIGVPGDLSVKPGQIIELDTPSTDSTGGQKRFGGKWLIYAIDHIMISGSHAMRLFLCRDTNNKVATK